MKAKAKVTLGDVYVDACVAYGKVPSQAGLDAWDGVLGGYQAHEVKQALSAWQANDEVDDFTKRTRGSVMPAPSELKAIVFRSRREERSRLRFKSCGNCHEGQVVTMIPGLDGRIVRAFGDCECLIAWRVARDAASAGI